MVTETVHGALRGHRRQRGSCKKGLELAFEFKGQYLKEVLHLVSGAPLDGNDRGIGHTLGLRVAFFNRAQLLKSFCGLAAPLYHARVMCIAADTVQDANGIDGDQGETVAVMYQSWSAIKTAQWTYNTWSCRCSRLMIPGLAPLRIKLAIAFAACVNLSVLSLVALELGIVSRVSPAVEQTDLARPWANAKDPPVAAKASRKRRILGRIICCWGINLAAATSSIVVIEGPQTKASRSRKHPTKTHHAAIKRKRRHHPIKFDELLIL